MDGHNYGNFAKIVRIRAVQIRADKVNTISTLPKMYIIYLYLNANFQKLKNYRMGNFKNYLTTAENIQLLSP